MVSPYKGEPAPSPQSSLVFLNHYINFRRKVLPCVQIMACGPTVARQTL